MFARKFGRSVAKSRGAGHVQHTRKRVALQSLSLPLSTRRNVSTDSEPVETPSAVPEKGASRTALDKIIHDSIKATGHITVSQYMQLCASHPTEGYYMNPNNPVFGSHGDFITSPEISQIFGELIAVWHLSRWIAAGKPKKIRVVELGPGRGTLMNDALRTWNQFKGFMDALKSVSLVETSPMMREFQETSLKPWRAQSGYALTDRILWRNSVDDVLGDKENKPDAETFTILVAHEFFDALPVHVIERSEKGWHEIQITSIPDHMAKDVIKPESKATRRLPYQFVRTAEPTLPARLLGESSPRFAALPVGARIEVSPTSFMIARKVAELVNNPKSAGGSALIIDYGNTCAFGASLRGFNRHEIVDIFEMPGRCDITANVDFAFLKEAIQDTAQTHGPIEQGTFLQQMNMEVRLAKLINNAKKDDGRKKEVKSAARRLVDPNGMGKQYKVLAVTGTGARTSDEKDVWPFLAGIRGW